MIKTSPRELTALIGEAACCERCKMKDMAGSLSFHCIMLLTVAAFTTTTTQLLCVWSHSLELASNSRS